MDDRSARKAAKNEALSRSLNEGLARGEEKWPSTEPTFICECAELSCTQELRVPLETYTQVRTDPARFILAPGHNDPRLERIVEEDESYQIVEKIGPGRDEVL